MHHYDEVKVLDKKCLTFTENQTEHPSVYSTTLNNVSYLYDKIGELDRAMPLMTSVVSQYLKNLGDDLLLYANALNNYAALRFKI